MTRRVLAGGERRIATSSSSDSVRRSALVDDFLVQRNLQRAHLRRAVSHAFGPPRLAVVAGSVAAGFGNEQSDIDVFTVVDWDDVSPLPIPSYFDGSRVDVRYFPADAVRSWGRQLETWFTPVVPLHGSDPEAFMRARYALENAARFSVSSTLELGDLTLADLLGGVDVARASRSYWLAEAVRHAFVSAAATRSGHSGAAVLRRQECCLALLEAKACELGEFYFGPKWLGEKLRRVHALDLARLIPEILDTSTTPDWYERVADELGLAEVQASTGPLGALRVVVLPASEVAVHDVFGRTMVSRWGLRGRWLDDAVPMTTSPSQPWWSGGPLEQPGRQMDALIGEGFCWVALEGAA